MTQAEGFRELNLMEALCPFQLFYSNSVEQLGAESSGVCVCWVSAIWWVLVMSFVLQADSILRGVLDHSVTVPNWSETQLPMGSMCLIWSMASTSTHSDSITSGLQSTTFLPPMESIPNISDFQSLLGSSVGSFSLCLAVNDSAISNQTIVHLEDPWVSAPSCSRPLCHTTSMMNLVEEFDLALQWGHWRWMVSDLTFYFQIPIDRMFYIW